MAAEFAARPLATVRIFFYHLVGDSHQVLTVVTLERLIDFYFNAHTALQVDMIQVVASKERWPVDLLPETL